MNRVFVTAIVNEYSPEEIKEYLPAAKVRRLGLLQKRALVTAIKAMKISGIEKPDMILNGTVLGCIDNSMKMLDALTSEGESMSMPTAFMQSTHNNIASLIANFTDNHAYNATYSHGAISFESALHDAFLNLKCGNYKSALVCKNDEIPDYLRQNPKLFGNIPILDISESWILTTDISSLSNPLFEIENVRIVHNNNSQDIAEIIKKIFASSSHLAPNKGL